MSEVPHEQGSGLENVDAAALVLAATAAFSATLLASGDWGIGTTIIGFPLLLAVVAFHRGVGRARTPRDWLRKLAFGGVVSLALYLTLAWLLQEVLRSTLYPGSAPEDGSLSRAAYEATFWLNVLFWPATAVTATFESNLVGVLDRPSVGRAS